jgi:hypothetical protein
MSNRRPRRPDGGFLRNKRRTGLNMLAMLEGAPAPRKSLLARILHLLRRRRS